MSESRPALETWVTLDRGWSVCPGHVHALRGPVLLGSLSWPARAQWNLQALKALLRDPGGVPAEEIDECLVDGLNINAFLALVPALERAALSPVTQPGRQTSSAQPTAGAVMHHVAFSCFTPRFTRQTVDWLTWAINMCNPKMTAQRRHEVAGPVQARLEKERATFAAYMKPAGVNWARLVRASNELDLPFQLLPRRHLQIGSGPNARLFKSTLTETTLAIPVNIAKSKSLTASILALHGIPVPAQKTVVSAEQALAAAHDFGYPVVVKPDDCDGGTGVNAGLETDEQVREAYAQAAAVSKHVLLESHVAGSDFRITVDQGEVIKAIGRTPGGVLGDGTRSILQLVEALAAAKPALRGNNGSVTLDEEAMKLLADRGMTVMSIPPADEFVPLRRRANMSTGGTSYDVLPTIHPDNARLAIRVAQALRLDLAGVDLIIPDIAVSWMDCKAAICEVNAQPQISTEFAPEVFRNLIKRLVAEPRRMRSVLLVNAGGQDNCDESVIEAAAEWTARGERVLSVRSDGTWLGEERFAPPGRTPFAAALAAELEPEATAVVAALTTQELRDQGLPWMHVDLVRVLRGANGLDAAQAKALERCLEGIAPHALKIEH